MLLKACRIFLYAKLAAAKRRYLCLIALLYFHCGMRLAALSIDILILMKLKLAMGIGPRIV